MQDRKSSGAQRIGEAEHSDSLGKQQSLSDSGKKFCKVDGLQLSIPPTERLY